MIFVILAGAVIVVGIISFIIWDVRRNKKRRDSLRQSSDGTFIWIDFDGSERRSDTHPDEEGGEWHVDGTDGTGISDGDGGGGGD